MRRTTTWIWAKLAGLLAGVSGCLPVGMAGDETGSTSVTSLSASTTVEPTGGTTRASFDATSSGSYVSTTGGSETGGSSTVVAEPDIPRTCDLFMQDCPAGQKCTPYADDGGSSWNNSKCVPVVEDPVQLDEPCFAPEGGVAGIDNCDHGLFCWNVDPEGKGTCVAHCKGYCGDGFCEPPKTTCVWGADCTLALCFPGCDPVAQDCDPGDACIENPNGEGFLCVTDASGDEGQAHDPCMFANACDPGLLCNDPAAAEECDPNATGCCEPFCDLSDPDADSKCPGVGQVCNPYYEEGTAPDYENVGYCAVPM